MSGTSGVHIFGSEQQQETIIKKPGNSYPEQDYQPYRYDDSIVKSIKEYVTEKLDKILIVVLILVVLFFIFHAPGEDNKIAKAVSKSQLLKESQSQLDIAPKRRAKSKKIQREEDDELFSEDQQDNLLKKRPLTKNQRAKKDDFSDDSELFLEKPKPKRIRNEVEEEKAAEDENQIPSAKKNLKKGNRKQLNDFSDQESELFVKKAKAKAQRDQDDLNDEQKFPQDQPKKQSNKNTKKPISGEQQNPQEQNKQIVKGSSKKKKHLEMESQDDWLFEPKQKKQAIDSLDDQQKKKNKVVSKQQQTAQKIRAHEKRSQFLKTKQKFEHLEYIKMAQFNLNVPSNEDKELDVLLKSEQDRLQSKYHLSQYTQQLSLCVVVYAQSSKKAHAHQYVLNSILNQKYSNYSVVYTADGYSDDQLVPIKEYLQESDTGKKVTLVHYAQKKYYLESTINAINDHCLNKKVTVLVNGDDELLGRNVFRVLNAVYRETSANLVYGNFIEYHQVEQQLKLGFSIDYDKSQKKENKYRSVGQKFGSLKTFRSRLVTYIEQQDLKDKSGEFYHFAGDYALMYPLLELSCGMVHYLPEYNYLYFGYEIDPKFVTQQIDTGKQIRWKEHYNCFKSYK